MHGGLEIVAADNAEQATAGRGDGQAGEDVARIRSDPSHETTKANP
jgi:hypothetical protein